MFAAEINNKSKSTIFWAWNGSLDERELVRQLNWFSETGLAGFFIHSREGLETRYLGEQWLRCVKTVASAASQMGLDTWIYDEDRFPSGTCGGRVTLEDDGRHALHGLTIEVCREAPRDGDIRAVYIAKPDGEGLSHLERVGSSEALRALSEGEVYLAVRFETSKGSDWFNGGAPPDNLDPDTVRAFLRLTHEVYREALRGAASGAPEDASSQAGAKAAPSGVRAVGFFTDEPSLADRHAAFNPRRTWMPWSCGMEEFYSRVNNGADIYDTFPYLFFEGEESSCARFMYWKAVALRFEECYSAQIGAWCKANGFLFTGHYLQEDKLGLCTRVNGSVMPHYTHEDIPGIDILGERCEEYLTVKQAVSVARQYGKSRVFAETYAACGWDVTLTALRWIAEWEYVLGVTNRVIHQSVYTMRGSRKRDYPAFFGKQFTAFPMLKLLEDRLARLSSLLQQGRAVCDVLIIHPMTTVWTRFGSSPYGNPVRRRERDLEANNNYGYGLNSLIKKLEHSQIDVDLGDETLIARDGYVSGASFCINKSAYKVVILPALDNICESTLRLLAAFDGTIVVLGSLPSMVDGVKSDEPRRLLQKKAVRVKDGDALVALVSNTAVISADSDVLVQVRKDGDEYLVYVVNNSRTDAKAGFLKTRLCGKVASYSAESGEETDVDAVYRAGILRIPYSLKPVESAVFIIDTSREMSEAESAPHASDESEWREERRLTGPFPVTLDRKNVLVLDKADFTLDGEMLLEDCFIWLGENEIRRRLGMFLINTDEEKPGYIWLKSDDKKGHKVEETFTFYSQVSLKDCLLALETSGEMLVEINGARVARDDSGFYLDNAFRTIKIGDIKEGRNCIKLECNYRAQSALEAIYLIGDFSVDASRVLAAPVRTLGKGSITTQGLYHYPGVVEYHAVIPYSAGRIRVQLPEMNCSAKELVINGRVIPMPYDSDMSAEVTEYLRAGDNDAVLRLYTSPGNMLGPLHLKGGKPQITKAASFVPEGEAASDEYNVVGYALKGDIVIKRAE